MDDCIQKLKENTQDPTLEEVERSISALSSIFESENRKISKKEDDMLAQLSKLLFGAAEAADAE